MSALTKPGMAELFRKVFGAEASLIVRSPGRINMIGEHTDYNDGFVLPAAIDKAILVAVRRRDDEEIHLYAEEFAEKYTVLLDDIAPRQSWTDYILGVVSQYVKREFKIAGFELLLSGNIPIGAGLSSSAAVECASAFAMNEIFSTGIGKMELVNMARMAEHEFAGVKCGIMDQFASMFGKKDNLIQLDCRSLEYVYTPIDMQGVQLVLFNSNVKHSLASSEYNVRREQCEAGVAMVRKKYPQVNSLRDVSNAMLEELVLPNDELIYRRCHYVVNENARLLTACEDLRRGNIAALGEKMLQTHDGLSKSYGVSCPELDFLVEQVRDMPSVLGARMVGGGFGGCTLNLIQIDAVDEITNRVAENYRAKMGMELTAYIVSAEDGTSVL